MKLYAFDPGKTTGWAYWDTDKSEKPIQFGSANRQELNLLLRDITSCDVFVVEDYKIRNTKQSKGFNHQWNKGETLRIIGILEFRADQIGAKLILQQPNIKAVGAGFGGIPHVQGKHDNTHYLDAMKHGFYYLVKNKEILPIGKKGS